MYFIHLPILEDENTDSRKISRTNFTKSRRALPITSIWAKKSIGGKHDITSFMREGKCGLFDRISDYSVAERVWQKLTNVLILASLSPAAAGPRPLILPLSQIQKTHPRYVTFIHQHHIHSFNYMTTIGSLNSNCSWRTMKTFWKKFLNPTKRQNGSIHLLS